MYRIWVFWGKIFCHNGVFDERKRDKDPILLQWEVSGDAHAEHIAVLTVHIDDGVNVLLRDARTLAPVDMERAVAASVFVMAVIKEAAQPCLRRKPNRFFSGTISSSADRTI